MPKLTKHIFLETQLILMPWQMLFSLNWLEEKQNQIYEYGVRVAL